jgi:hypothetical protein
MKKSLSILIVILLHSYLSFGQSEAEKKIKQEIWSTAPAEFKSTKVPDKWKNESAVMLAFTQDYVMDFTTKVVGIANVTRFYIEIMTIHYRIKLLDKAAVADFSEISFNNKTVRRNLFGKANSYNIIAIKVIKSNGAEKEVDLSNAVKTDAGSSKDLKIPIPDLEAGDIIDYFITIRDENTVMPDFGDEELLERKYPVVTQSITFKIPHQVNFYSYSYNGAAEFKKQVIDKDVLYSLKEEMREKAPDMPWNYRYQTSPQVRYRVTSQDVQDPKKNAENILAKFEVPYVDVGVMVDYMDGNFKKEKDPTFIAKELFYLLRNPIYREAYFEIKQGDPLEYEYTPDYFFLLYQKILTKYKIDHELILAPSREFGPIDRLVNFGSCDLMIRVNTTPPLFIPRPTPFALPGEIPSSYEGVEGVPKPFMTKNRLTNSTTAEQNATVAKIAVALNPTDPAKLDIKRTVTASGHNKPYHQYRIFTSYDYLKDYDQPKYQVQSSNLMRGLIKTYNKEKVKFEQRKVQDYHDRDERIKTSIEQEMDVKVSEYKNLTVKTIGMWDAAPTTEYSDEFTIENIAKKAGPNIILELGRLIEKQTQIKEEQKVRTRTVNMDYPRSFTYEISLAIPNGYKVEGYDHFNKRSETELGGFVSSAKLEGNNLVIKTKKYYNRYQYTPEEWPRIVTYLNLSVDFYNEKLLLKKK